MNRLRDRRASSFLLMLLPMFLAVMALTSARANSPAVARGAAPQTASTAVATATTVVRQHLAVGRHCNVRHSGDAGPIWGLCGPPIFGPSRARVWRSVRGQV